MRFAFLHEFDIPLDALELAVISPHLGERLAARLDSVEKVTSKEHVVEGSTLTRVLAFQANVKLPAFARGVVTKEMCAWDERSTYDFRTHSSSWTIVPHIKPEWQHFFRASGTYFVEALGEGRSRRRVEGEIELAIPLLLRTVAERLILNEVKKTFDAEALTLRELATLA